METFKKINSEKFQNQVIVYKADALVRITNDWNSSSKFLSKTLDELAQQYEGNVDFFSVDSETEEVVVSTYRIKSTPTLLFFKKEKLVDSSRACTTCCYPK